MKGDERRQIATTRHIELVVPKENDEWWPRLLKNAIKVPWLKVSALFETVDRCVAPFTGENEFEEFNELNV